jgi:hypothetical protein
VLELLESIARMLEVLKPKVRQAFLLAQCEGLTHKHIAEQMGLSLRSVERCVRRRAVSLMPVDNLSLNRRDEPHQQVLRLRNNSANARLRQQCDVWRAEHHEDELALEVEAHLQLMAH